MFWPFLSSVAAFVTYFLVTRAFSTSRRWFLKGKVILVTGCDSGLGRELCLVLGGDYGAHVVATCLKQQTCDNDSELHDACLSVIQMDVSNLESVESGMRQCAKASQRKGLFAVVNNAGLMLSAPMECVSVARSDALWNVNAMGAVRVTRSALPLLRGFQLSAQKCDARVINVSSISSQLFTPFVCDYVCSKAALNTLADAIRFELATLFGIRVCSVLPSALRTPMTAAFDRQFVALKSDDSLFDNGKIQAMLKSLTALVSPMSHSPRVAVDSIMDALTAANPAPYYFPTLDAWLTCLAANYLPAFIFDLLFLVAFDTSILK